MPIRKIEVRSAFNYDVDAVSVETGFACEGDSLAQQQFSDECDINTIVKRFGITGHLPQTVNMPVSGDFTGLTDFASAMRLVTEAREEFMKMSADVRARFENDPQRLISFIEDPKNMDEARELGLLKPLPEKTRDAVQAIDELAASLKKE